MTSTFDALFDGRTPPSISQIEGSFSESRLKENAVRRGWGFYGLDFSQVEGADGAFEVISKGMSFPWYFGKNWDALFDCLTDLSWDPKKGYILHCTGLERIAEGDRPSWETLKGVWQDAIEDWSSRQTPMFVLVQRPPQFSSPSGRG